MGPTASAAGEEKGRARLARMCDAARSRYVFQALDAVVTSPDHGERVRSRRPPSSNYAKVHRVVERLSRVLHGVPARARRALVDTSKLPFPCDDVGLLGFGAGATVFLVRTRGSPRVLKVFRRSLGRSTELIMEEVRRRRAIFARLSSWFDNGEGESVLLPTHFLALHGPVLGLGVAASVQPFLDVGLRDVFDVPETELVERLRRDRRLLEQVRRFAQHSAEVGAREDAFPDLVGADNLVLVEEGDGARLVLLDPGILEIGFTAVRAPAALRENERRIAYLHRVVKLATTPGTAP